MLGGSSVCVAFIIYSLLNYCCCETQIGLPNQPIKDALFLHNSVSSNLTLRDCSFRPTDNTQQCPDPDIRYILYSGGEKQLVDFTENDWLKHSNWDPSKEDVILIHGYAGSDGGPPMAVLRDAYISNDSYNVWIVDWGALAPPPCYRGAVHNLKAVARCTGELLMALKSAGLPAERMTCIGHSLGAHICGIIANHVLFRMHRIIGLDPARPLVPSSSRLSSTHATAVHILHTNAGHYGETGRSGHVDFCINGGRIQPYCENIDIDINICSHVAAVCFLAESLHSDLIRRAEPCTRRCPTARRPGRPSQRVGLPIPMGHFTPMAASGSYCIHDTRHEPFCPTESRTIGDIRCCVKSPKIKPFASTEISILDIN